MAIQSSDQITLIDVTDAYSVMLTSEAFVFSGDVDGIPANSSCKTQVLGFCGGTQISNISIGNIVCPANVTASIIDNNTAKPEITFTTSAKISTSCEAKISVVIDGIPMEKVFSFAVASKGVQGNPGAKGDTGNPGADSLALTVTSSNGSIFRNNTGTTVLTAHIYKGAIEQTIDASGVCGNLGTVKWYKAGNTTPVAVGKTLTVHASDVLNSVVYTAQLE